MPNRNRIAALLAAGGLCNSLVLDIFSISPQSGIDFITKVRSAYPTVPICLFSRSSDLANLPGINEYWRKRFGHFYRIPNDLPIQALEVATSGAIIDLGNYLQASLARYRLGELKSQIANDPQGLSIESRANTVQVITQAEQALAKQSEMPRIPASFVPGLDVEKIQKIISDTLTESKNSLQLTRTVNIGVVVLGAIIVLVSFGSALFTGNWASVAFGGFGIAGIIAALISSPLKSISASSGRQVQIETAYFGLLTQLNLLSQSSDSITVVERSQRLMEIVERTVNVLSEQQK